MKILHLTDSFNHCCGRSRHIQALAQETKKTGHSPFVVFGAGDGAPMLESYAIPYVQSDYLFHDHRSFANLLRGILFIARTMFNGKFDIVHAHHRYAALMARIPCLFFRVPLVMTIHGTVKNRGIFPAHAGTWFVAVSESVRTFAVREDPGIADRVSSIPYGIDVTQHPTDREALRKQWNIPPGTVVISMIGRLVEHKGHRVLLEALHRLSTTEPFRVFIVGEGPYEKAIRVCVEQWQLPVVFTGVVQEPAAFFELSDIIAIPSYDFEGLPITLLEAGKSGTAVIVSDVAGMHDIIRDGINGIILPPGDVDGFADALRQLFENVALRISLGNALRSHIVRNHSIERMTEDTLSLYAELRIRGRNAD